MATGTQDRKKLVFVVLGIALAASLLFVRFLGEPTTERLRPQPDATSEPMSAQPMSAQPTPAPLVVPTPTALAIPATGGIELPDGSVCPSIPGDRAIGDTVFIDLDRDGDSDAIGPEIRLDLVGGLIEYGIFLAVGECRWEPLGFLGEGRTRDGEGNESSHSWTCGQGRRIDGRHAINLVQVITETRPALATSITQYSVVEGELVEHQPTVVNGRVELSGHGVACDPLGYTPDLTMQTQRCGGRSWTVDVPAGWLTPAAGAESCQWFTAQSMGIPCQCDAVPPIRIALAPLDSMPDAGLFSKTVVDGYPATLSQRLDLPGMDGPVNERSYSINLGDELLVLTARSHESHLPWDELSAELDLFAEATEIVGQPAPTMEMFYPEFPELGSRPLYLDPAGVFAWYRSNSSASRTKCDDPEPAYLARLTVAASRSDELQITPVGPVAPGQQMAIRPNDDGSVTLTVGCVDDGAVTYLQQTLRFEENGAIAWTGAATATPTVLPERQVSGVFPESPDGAYRYASGDDPQGRLDYGCTNGSQNNPSPAQTLLRYERESVTPAFPDGGLTGSVRNMQITDSGFAIWESLSCQSVGLHVGRLTEDGSIVDRHLVSAQGIVDQSWVVTDTDELVILTPRYENTESYPSLRRVALAESPGWVITADPPLRIDEQPILRSFSGEESWRLGENRAADGECAGDTIYVDEPGGPRRVSNYARDIEGSVVRVVTSGVVDGPEAFPESRRRIVVALAECPSQYEGYTLWFAHEFERSRVLTFHQVATGPIRDVQVPFFDDTWPNRPAIEVEFLDGTVATVDLVPEY